MSSITGLGLRNKVGLGKPNDSSPRPKQQGSSITGLGLRNKAAGLAGKKGPDQTAPEHVVTPRSALIDPSSFAPPPKNVNYYGTAAEERQVNRISQRGPLTPAAYQAREKEKADREKEEEARQREERRLDREAKQSLRVAQQGNEGAYGACLPYRSDTTGLSTTQFAIPVARSSATDGTIVIRPTAPSEAKAKPPLPPRLPPRQKSGPEIGEFVSQGESSAQLPQRLARLGTGPSPHSPTSDDPQLSELQSRYARMKASSPKAEDTQAQGLMWTGQGALPAASSLRDESITTSLLNARNLASKSNNFRESHGEKTAKGWKPDDTSNLTYGPSGNVTSQGGSAQTSFEQGGVERPIELKDNTLLVVKKAPPPRPKKKAELVGRHHYKG